MLAGLCMNPLATNAVTITRTWTYFPMIVRLIKATNAAMPTSRLPSTPRQDRPGPPFDPADHAVAHLGLDDLAEELAESGSEVLSGRDGEAGQNRADHIANGREHPESGDA